MNLPKTLRQQCKNRTIKTSLAFLLLNAVLLSPVAAATRANALLAPQAIAPRYRVVNLGSTTQGSSAAVVINPDGLVVGVGSNNGAYGIVWKDTSVIFQERGWLPASMNSSETMAGFVYRNTNDFEAAIYPLGKEVLPLGAGQRSRAFAINENEQVTGYTGGTMHAFVWDMNNGITDLGTFGGSYSYGSAINDSGTVVGLSMLAGDTVSRGFVWDEKSGMRELSSLGAYSSSGAYDINTTGTIVGSVTPDNIPINMPCYWTSSGELVLLPMPADIDSGSASKINAKSQILGELWRGNTPIPSIWQNNSVQLLQDLIPEGSGWTLRFAYDISDSGVIVGEGLYEGRSQAYMLVPISR